MSTDRGCPQTMASLTAHTKVSHCNDRHRPAAAQPTWIPPPPGAGAGSDPAQLRVSDAEREAVAQALGDHHATGRLDASEWTERLESAFAARTRGELDALLADLPILWVRPSRLFANEWRRSPPPRWYWSSWWPPRLSPAGR